MALLEEVRKGRREGLEALRDRLAEELDQCESSRDVAALSSRLADVLEQVAGLTGQQPGAAQLASAVDEFTQRRQGRAGA